jgi:hypothetical protein
MITQFKLAEVEFQVMPLAIDEQFEVEVILLSMFGPAAGAAIAALVEGAAPALISVLRDATGAGEQFDLAKLMSRPKAAETLRGHWIHAIEMLRASQQRTGSSVTELLSVASTGRITDLWRGVVVELERLAGAVVEPGESLDYADPQLQTAWGELLGALVENLHETVGRGEAFDLARLLPLPSTWLLLLSASLAEVVRETAGRGRFDLAGIIKMDTTDPRLRDAWEALLGTLTSTLADLVRGAIYALAGRLSVSDVKRLFELVVLSKKVMVPAYGGGYITTYEVMSRILPHPQAKWDLLVRCLLVTYGGSRVAAEGGNA